MAEGIHTEDSPLLGGSSPAHTSPAPPWPATPPPPAPQDPPLPPWPPDHAWMVQDVTPVHIPQPKGVRSQASMDSGCECDDGPPLPTPHPPSHHHHHHHHPPAGLSPLSPSQPGGSGPPTPGPSEMKGGGDPTPNKVKFTFHGDDDDDDNDDRLVKG